MPLEHFDLKIASRTLVQASRPPPGFPAVHAVSNLDLVLGPFPIWLVCLYGPPPCGLDAVLSAVRAALPAYLSRFFPFAGRVVRDPATNIPQVACSNAGAELVVADAAVPLAAADFARVDRSLSLIQAPSISLTVATNHLLADSLAEMVTAIERRLYRVDAATSWSSTTPPPSRRAPLSRPVPVALPSPRAPTPTHGELQREVAMAARERRRIQARVNRSRAGALLQNRLPPLLRGRSSRAPPRVFVFDLGEETS